MRINTLTKRNFKEITRDPVSIIFCLILPVVFLVAMELIFMNVKEGAEMFRINNFAPAVSTFGFTFTMLYTALMISGDRESAFMTRILVSPTKKYEYLLSYALSGIPVMIAQALIFYVVSFIFGLPFTGYTFLSVIFLLPAILFYLACGVLIGSVAKNDKQAGPICSIIITLSGLLGGVWMPIQNIGGTFLKVCEWLPFYNGIRGAVSVINGDFTNVIIYALITLAYFFAVFLIAVFVFTKRIKNR